MMNNLPLVVVVYTHYWFFQQPESLNVGKKEKYFHFILFTESESAILYCQKFYLFYKNNRPILF